MPPARAKTSMDFRPASTAPDYYRSAYYQSLVTPLFGSHTWEIATNENDNIQQVNGNQHQHSLWSGASNSHHLVEEVIRLKHENEKLRTQLGRAHEINSGPIVSEQKPMFSGCETSASPQQDENSALHNLKIFDSRMYSKAYHERRKLKKVIKRLIGLHHIVNNEPNVSRPDILANLSESVELAGRKTIRKHYIQPDELLERFTSDLIQRLATGSTVNGKEDKEKS